MTHEQLIADCTEYSTSMTNMERAPQGCSLLSQATAALRELQAELVQLHAFKASMTTAIAQAVSDALAQADEQHKADMAELQAEITRKDRQLEKGEAEYQAILSNAHRCYTYLSCCSDIVKKIEHEFNFPKYEDCGWFFSIKTDNAWEFVEAYRIAIAALKEAK